MKKSSDRGSHPVSRGGPRRGALERDALSPREPVPDYFTLYLLQELLSCIGLRHRQ